MSGIKFIKVQPTTYLLQYRGGNIVREGLEKDFLEFNSGTKAVIGIAEKKGVLVE